MDKTYSMLGRAVLLAGIVPTLLWVAINLAFFWQADKPFPQRYGVVPGADVIGLAIAAGVAGGALLYGLNGVIIRLYEGSYGLPGRLLAGAQRRNAARHHDLYRDLLAHRRRRDEELANPTTDGRPDGEADWRRRVDSTVMAVDQAHAGIERHQETPLLPLNAELVKPTALGNAYAVMEEYPYERYGMDSMVFWPRLVAVLPAQYREAVGDQKTVCDFLLHTSLLLALWALEALVAALLWDGASARWRLVLLATVPASLVIAYALYRAAVAETVVLGKLIAGAFDLYRHDLLKQFRITPPSHLPEERVIWHELGAFIRRGEDFYYPAPSVGDARATEPAREPEP